MARPRSAGYDDQRSLILRRAAALFAAQGYAATSMNQVASACGVSKAALYHYVRDKNELLARVAEAHVLRLAALVDEVQAEGLAPPERLRALIVRFVREYASAENEHRVLTEDVGLLDPAMRERVLGLQRGVVAAFAETVSELRPDLRQADLHKPLTMLLFGMINWLFTWFRPGQALSHEQMGPLVADLFLGGLAALAQASPQPPSLTPLAAAPARTGLPQETTP